MSKGKKDEPPPVAEEIKICTIPFDPRFPQANQTLNCYVHYTDYYRCLDALDGDEDCEYFKKVFTVLCPNAWVEKWDEQRANGNFAGRTVRVPADYCLQKKQSEEDCN